MLLMGKSAISMAMFNSYVTNYQRVEIMVNYWSNSFCGGPEAVDCVASIGMYWGVGIDHQASNPPKNGR